MSNLLCRLPWQGLDISPQGDYRPCCKYTESISSNIDEYFNSDKLVALKEQFTNGDRPAACQRCWDDEAAGKLSKRQIDGKFLENIPHDDTIRIISYPTGNICNLTCNHCSSYASSKWLLLAKKLQPKFPSIPIHPHTQYYKDIEFQKKITSISDDVLLVEFPGGEPFYTGTAEHLHYLLHLIHCAPEEKSLHYMTNCTVFPELRFWDIWAMFKKVDIQFSLDGHGPQFEYMRYPGNWEEVYDNIKQYQRRAENRKNIQISIGYTVSILNVFYLPEFIKWCDYEKLPTPYIGFVNRAPHYDIRSLPPAVKMVVANKLEMSKELEFVVDYMMSENLPFTFYEWNNALDEAKGQHYADYFPQFAALLKTELT